jgi:hypothetical protein
MMGRALAVMLTMLGCVAVAAHGAQNAKLKVSFASDELGVNTTIGFDATIVGTRGGVPSPMLGATFTMPSGFGLSTSTLGLATCDPQALLAYGTESCPTEAIIGYGSVRVEVPFGPQVVPETAAIAILMGVAVSHHTQLLLYADGESPLSTQIVIPVVLGGTSSAETQLPLVAPVIATVPGAPDASVVGMRIIIGPKGLVYFKHVRGKIVGYRPSGIAVPETCPHGGFDFTSNFRFQDGTDASATTRVPCPSRPSRRR